MAVFIFPGQGSQQRGMARAFAALARSARFAFVDPGLLDLMWNGTPEQLARTEITQPAVYVAGLLAYESFRRRWPAVAPACVAGHSLGEITAVACAGGVSYAEGYRIASTRARLMAGAPAGGMTAIIGLSRARLEEAIAPIAGVVIANQNAPQQFVLSGPHVALDRAEASLATTAKRIQRLPISLAAHSPMMASAVEPFADFLRDIRFSDLTTDLVNAADGRPLRRAEELRTHLAAQLCRGVDWLQVARALGARGVGHVVELGGDGKVAKLLSRTLPELQYTAVHDGESLETCLAA